MHLSKCSVYYSKRNIIYQKQEASGLLNNLRLELH